MKKSKNKGYQACKKTGKNDQKKKKKKNCRRKKMDKVGDKHSVKERIMSNS